MKDAQAGRPDRPVPAEPAVWLSRRDSNVPATLRNDCRAALARVGDRDTVAAALAEAASVCLQRALEASPGRAAAGPLLAADALLTWAMEAGIEEKLSADTITADLAQRLAGMVGPP